MCGFYFFFLTKHGLVCYLYDWKCILNKSLSFCVMKVYELFKNITTYCFFSQYQHGNVAFHSNFEFCFKLLLGKHVKFLFILAKK